jgi:hypothetical protein
MNKKLLAAAGIVTTAVVVGYLMRDQIAAKGIELMDRADGLFLEDDDSDDLDLDYVDVTSRTKEN